MASNRRVVWQIARIVTRNKTFASRIPFAPVLSSSSSCSVHAGLLNAAVTTGSPPRRHFSSSADNFMSLKNMIKPFYLKCHPDVQSTTAAKRINLQALQTINGLLDITEATCQGRVVEWPDFVEIEFMITLQERVKKDIVETSSRRKVELTLPSMELRDAILRNDPVAVRRLQHHVRLEFAKLLKVAGLPAPVVLPPSDDYDDSMETAWDAELDFLHNDGSESSRCRFRVSRAKVRYNQSKDRFMKSVDWGRIQRMTHEAVQEMNADLATDGFIRSSAQRRQDVITEILSKVRIEQGADIPMVDQLIAFRRLSLILGDNFDELHMEDMGRMWENLVLVLKPERDYNTSGSAMRKRTKRAQETGYQFSYGANEVVTIHIPIDFGDEELVTELERNLWDFYNLIGEGVEDLYPRWFTEL